MGNERNQRKESITKERGIFEETAELKEVLLWGEPGAEAVLGQILPEEISCFYENFDVHEARKEFRNAQKLLESQGVKVYLVKDLFAETIKNSKQEGEKENAEDLIEDLIKEVIKLSKEYSNTENLENIQDWIIESIYGDVERYGEDVAVKINRELALGNGLPLANTLYARDQSNLVGNLWIWSSMKHRIRQPEVDLYKRVIEKSQILGNNLEYVQVNGEKARFEGGDGIVFKGNVYIGVGGRTNKEGILEIADKILDQGMRLFVPIDKERDEAKIDEMDAMHLDTFFMPCGENEVVACIPEIERREILEVVRNGKELVFKERGGFIDHIKSIDAEIVEITKEEQTNFAPNFLNLGSNKIILSLKTKKGGLADRLREKGKVVLTADLDNITKGYGGLHCMSAPLRRG